MEEFEKLCKRLIKCQQWWETANENEHKAQENRLLELINLIDKKYMELNPNEQIIATDMLKASILR